MGILPERIKLEEALRRQEMILRAEGGSAPELETISYMESLALLLSYLLQSSYSHSDAAMRNLSRKAERLPMQMHVIHYTGSIPYHSLW